MGSLSDFLSLGSACWGPGRAHPGLLTGRHHYVKNPTGQFPGVGFMTQRGKHCNLSHMLGQGHKLKVKSNGCPTPPGFEAIFSARMSAVQPEALVTFGLTAVHSEPTQGLEPVGKGQAAAGFNAVLAPGVAAVEGAGAGAAVAGAAGAGIGVARLGRFLPPAFFRADFFFAAVFRPLLFTDFAVAFRPAALFFFFFAAFFAFFARLLAMTDLHQS
jgi:hypothetical protein